MPTYFRNDIVLVRYPFSDLSSAKVRPAVVVSAPHVSTDLFIVPLTSRLSGLLAGEFGLAEWRTSGLNVPTAVKRGLYTVHESLVQTMLGKLTSTDSARLQVSLRLWLDLN